MSEHRATITWRLGDGDFRAGHYDRTHDLEFEGGPTVKGSPSPSVVPAPWSRAEALDPEAAFTGALSACHMLWFLDLARQAGFVVAAYRDAAVGTLGRVGPRKIGMTRVVLRPEIAWAGESRPTEAQIAKLHHEAHARCFIANSVTTLVEVETA